MSIFIEEADVSSPLVDRLLRLLQHLYIDEESDALLEGMVAALASGLEPMALVAFGDDTTDQPWRLLTDPELAPLEWLSYATQWAGGILPPPLPGETAEAYLARARLEAAYSRGPRRGTPRAAEIIADRFLTGTKHFELTFDADNPRIIYVDTISSELADPAGLLAELNSPDVVVAGSRFEYLPTGITWNNLTTGHTWDEAGSVTWAGAGTTEP